ncbi:Cytochrome P450 2K1 [Labeo rohita]|uniref:Cytochrome P450 2K1 n=1 Tax=Labeo rohita TaxID=84645 RepID=A0ABQ8MVK4_LABRO|nr:Cytochrome P450 2K1 [Labeo rohita]
MAIVESLLQFPSTGTLLGALLLLLVLYLLSSQSKSQKERKEPPGPKPLPLVGNLLTLDLTRPFDTFFELSKNYGNIFQVFLGPKKTVVLVGYKTIKEALVNYAEEFGDREIAPSFRITNGKNGIIFSNGENWKEMRRFALSNLRDFGMGKRGSEEKIIEEIQYLKGEFDKFEGKAFDTTQPVNYAVSNIISSIVYGSRFKYTDPEFTQMVDRANENLRAGGSTSVMLCNIFPWLGLFLKNKKNVLNNILQNRQQMMKLINALQETLNPHDSRGFVDSFLIRKQNDECYRFTTPPGVSGDELDLKGVVGLTLNPSPHKLYWCHLNTIQGGEAEKMAVVEMLLQFPSTGTLLGALLLLLVLYLLSSESKSQKEGKEPPGPKPLPLVGNLLTLDLTRPFDTLFELSKTYGNIFQVFLVVLVGYKTVKEALVNHAEEFGDREIGPGFRIMNKGHGIIFSNGENWKEMRRFALSNLRDLGMGKRGSEEKIIEEIQYLKGEFDKFEGKAFDTTQSVNYAVSNIISSIVYGSRFEYTDPEFTEMVDRANENVRISGSTSIMLYNIFPWLGPFLKNKRIIVNNMVQNRQQITKLINGLLETLNLHDRRGFVDSFLIRKQSEEDHTKSLPYTAAINVQKSGIKDSFFSREQPYDDCDKCDKCDVYDQIPSYTVTKYILQLCANRVQEEVGRRQPVVELPYTDAVIHETQRLASIVPLSLPHVTSCDVTFNGYFIKKSLLYFPIAGTLLGALLLLLVLYRLSCDSKSQKERKEPPGPKPLPLLGNLLTLDLTRPFDSLCELSKTYGNIFQVFLGPKKMVVLVGYKTVKEALVNYADEFGERDITPGFRILNDGHGILFSNGESWKEMRRFALSNLRDFGMGKRGSEEKIIEEIQYLKGEFDKFEGKAFDTTQPVNYAVSNIISSIVYGSRFEYTDPQFTQMVDRANENVRVAGSASMMLYNIFPWLGPFLNSKRTIIRNLLKNRAEIVKLITGLQETLNPHDRRGFVDSFLIRKQNDESLARMELFLFFTSLLQTYRFTTPPGVSKDDLDLKGVVGVSSTGTLICCLLLFLAVYLLFFRSQRDKNEPPGPKPLPLLGNLLMLDVNKPYLSLFEMAKQFGPVFTVYFGPKKVVVLAGYKTVKQALVNHADEFGDREIMPLFHDFTKGHGIISANGESWREMRRFALTNLRDFGMGKKKIEEKIIEETCHLQEEFEKFEGKPFETTQLMNYAASSVICSIVYGRRFEYTDPQLRNMVDRANESIRLSGTATVQLYNMFPFLGPWLKNWRLLMKHLALDIKEISELVSGLRETLNPQDLRGFVDSFLVRMQNAEESGEKNSLFNQQNLIFSVGNLFAAGTDTTSTALRWGLLLMAKYPHIQDRVQKEIDQVIGGRQPVTEDRKNLPYTDAVIHETQRFADIVPMSIPHKTSCDVHFNGYFIKKVHRSCNRRQTNQEKMWVTLLVSVKTHCGFGELSDYGFSGDASHACVHHRSFTGCCVVAFDGLSLLHQLQLFRRSSRTQTTATAGEPAPTGPQTTSREPLQCGFLFLDLFLLHQYFIMGVL